MRSFRTESSNAGSVGGGAGQTEVPVKVEMAAFDEFGPAMRRLYLLTPLLMSAAGNLREIKIQEQRNQAKIKLMYPGISEQESKRMARIDLKDPRVDAAMVDGCVRFMTGIILKEGRDAHDVKLGMTPMVATSVINGTTSIMAARERRRMERAQVRLRLRPKKWRRVSR